MKLYHEIKSVKKEKEVELFDRPGVTAVDIGKKIKGGVKTDELAIRIYVKEKKDVPKAEQLPKKINGIKTDVIQRTFELHPLRVKVDDIELKADTATYDPLVGGISIGPCRAIDNHIFVGTLGAVVRDNDSNDPLLLSNFHVMCVDDGWSAGDTMAQPSRVDGGRCPRDIVGELQNGVINQHVDCAVSSVTDRDVANEVVQIGEIKGTAAAAEDMAVRKRGRTTGLTYGIIDTVDLSVRIDYEDGIGEVILTDQIGIEVDPAQSDMFGTNGDSGSVVVNDEERVVGLYFAGSGDGDYGVANPIAAVLDALNIHFETTKLPKEVKEIKEKDFKDRKEIKEKDLKDLKEKDRKDVKEKEFKEKDKEKEFKEFKEKDKEKDIKEKDAKEFKEKEKDIYEGGGRWPGMPGMGPTPFRAAPCAPETFGVHAEKCIDFSSLTPGDYPNPLFHGNAIFIVRDHQNLPKLNTRIATVGGMAGLDCGYFLEIFVCEPCKTTTLSLVTYSQPANVNTFDDTGGSLGSQTMTAAQGVVDTLTFASLPVSRIKIDSPQNEVFLLRFCCDRPDGGAKPILKDMDWHKILRDFQEINPKHHVREHVTPHLPREPMGGRGAAPGDHSIEERLSRIEEALGQLQHFIRPGLRPDLKASALKHEKKPEK